MASSSIHELKSNEVNLKWLSFVRGQRIVTCSPIIYCYIIVHFLRINPITLQCHIHTIFSKKVLLFYIQQILHKIQPFDLKPCITNSTVHSAPNYKPAEPIHSARQTEQNFRLRVEDRCKEVIRAKRKNTAVINSSRIGQPHCLQLAFIVGTRSYGQHRVNER